MYEACCAVVIVEIVRVNITDVQLTLEHLATAGPADPGQAAEGERDALIQRVAKNALLTTAANLTATWQEGDGVFGHHGVSTRGGTDQCLFSFSDGGVNAAGPAVTPVDLSTFLASDSDSKRWQIDWRDIIVVIANLHNKNHSSGAFT